MPPSKFSNHATKQLTRTVQRVANLQGLDFEQILDLEPRFEMSSPFTFLWYALAGLHSVQYCTVSRSKWQSAGGKLELAREGVIQYHSELFGPILKRGQNRATSDHQRQKLPSYLESLACFCISSSRGLFLPLSNIEQLSIGNSHIVGPFTNRCAGSAKRNHSRRSGTPVGNCFLLTKHPSALICTFRDSDNRPDRQRTSKL
jgi:hypothetical protein